MSARSPFHSWSLTRFQQIEAEQLENDAEEPQDAQDEQVCRHVLLLIRSLTRFQQIEADQLENDAEEPQGAQEDQVRLRMTGAFYLSNIFWQNDQYADQEDECAADVDGVRVDMWKVVCCPLLSWC